MAARQSLRVLCFGDSLTSGYYQFGLHQRPYARVLERRLRDAFPDTDVYVAVDGQPGALISGTERAQSLRQSYSLATFDWTLILGGTNDLVTVASKDAIFEGLKNLWGYALEQRSKVLAMTVPDIEGKNPHYDRARDSLNQKILSHQRDGFYPYDLRAHLPHRSLSPEERSKYWDDGVHLTRAGYDWMGGHIADELIATISREAASEKQGDAKAKADGTRSRNAYSRGDAALLEEEIGDPKRLSQGYVVVRKADLD